MVITPFAQIVNDQGQPAAQQVPGQTVLRGEPVPPADAPIQRAVTPPSVLPPPPWGPVATTNQPPLAGNQPPPAVVPGVQQLAPQQQDIAQEPQQQVTSEPQLPVQPKDDPASFQHWQSRADKLQKELDYERALRAELGQVDAISRHIVGQPPEVQMAILNSVQQTFPGGQPMGNTPEESLKRPVRPKKPSGYSFTDVAANETDSESYKYHAALEQWRDDMDNWRDVKAENENLQREQQAAHQQQQAFRMQADSQLREGGYDDAKRADFWRFMQHLNSQASVAEFKRLYELSQVPQSQDLEVQRRIQEMQQERARQQLQPPLGTEGGGSTPPPDTRTEGDALMDSLIERRARTNPFLYQQYQQIPGAPKPQKLKPPAW